MRPIVGVKSMDDGSGGGGSPQALVSSGSRSGRGSGPASRKASAADTVTTTAHAGPPTEFFLCSEEELVGKLAGGDGEIRGRGRDRVRKGQGERDEDGGVADSTYGIRSIADADGDILEGGEAWRDGRIRGKKRDRSLADGQREWKRRIGSREKMDLVLSDAFAKGDAAAHTKPSSAAATGTPVMVSPARRAPGYLGVYSMPSTPTHFDISLPNSTLPGSPNSVSVSSMHSSADDEAKASKDDGNGVVRVFGGNGIDGEDREESAESYSRKEISQFVMPSITISRRRSFTENGKRLGRLKVMVAGETGVSKSNLIKAMTSLCKDIVHVDTFAHHTKPTKRIKRDRQDGRLSDNSKATKRDKRILETFASTKPYYYRRSSLRDKANNEIGLKASEEALERNICFVDTRDSVNISCSADSGKSNAVMDYVVSSFENNMAATDELPKTIPEKNLGSVMSQVDVVLYVLDHDNMKFANLDLLRQLAEITNVIPLVGKADTLTKTETSTYKKDCLERLKAYEIQPFLFGKTIDEALRRCNDEGDSSKLYPGPFAASSIVGDDLESMDASVLMKSAYEPSLATSDLQLLVNQLFRPETTSWLRQTATRKFSKWLSRRHAYNDNLSMNAAAYLKDNCYGNGPAFCDSDTLNDWAESLGTLCRLTTTKSPRNYLIDSRKMNEGFNVPDLSIPSWAINIRRSVYRECRNHLGCLHRSEALSTDRDGHSGATSRGCLTAYESESSWACISTTSLYDHSTAKSSEALIDLTNTYDDGSVNKPTNKNYHLPLHTEETYSLSESPSKNISPPKPYHRPHSRHHHFTYTYNDNTDPNNQDDPLKLCALTQRLRTVSKTALKIFGSVGVLSVVVVALANIWASRCPVDGYSGSPASSAAPSASSTSFFFPSHQAFRSSGSDGFTEDMSFGIGSRFGLSSGSSSSLAEVVGAEILEWTGGIGGIWDFLVGAGARSSGAGRW